MRLGSPLNSATTTPSTDHSKTTARTGLASLLLAATAVCTTAAIAPGTASAAGTTAYVATTGSDSTGDGSPKLHR